MFKLKNYFILITLIIIFTLFINACGRKGKYEPDQPPIINITSYTGVDSSQIDTQEELDEWLANPTSFQQIIWWSAYDTDGVIEGYAFRVSIWDDELRGYVPVAVPGFDYINPEGWAYHYEVGADVNIPMDNPNANITIWSQLLHATINFPADGEVLTDEFGNPVYQEVLDGADSVLVYKPVRSLFEVKCIDDSGLESEIAEKHFNSESSAPKIIISSSQGDIDGETVGTGLIIEFTILDFDPLVEAEADRFEFMLLKKDAITNEIIPDAEENYGVWYTVPGDDDRGQAILTNTGYTEPAIIPNTFDENDVPLDSTLIVAKAYDIAGIVSREDTISFVVKEGFHPGTFIYTGKYQNGNDVWILGDNHFVTYQDGQINRVIPNVLRPDGNHFSTPFWINLAGDYTAINSDDLNIYMHWGWFGEFKLNDPRERILNAVKDEETGALYFSEIIYFDLRLDGAPFVYPPLPAEWFNITDDDGTEWLRVPIFYEIGQNAVLYDLASGEHTFEVRAVDLQLIPDPTPATCVFYLVDPVPLEDKSGILVIDDSYNDNFAPDDTTDTIYEYMLQDFSGTVDVQDWYTVPNDNQLLHFNRSKFAATDLINYQMIIFHSDNPGIYTHVYLEYDPIYLYLRGGGNFILSGGAGLEIAQMESVTNYYRFFDEYFGIPLPIDGDESTQGNINRVSWDGTNGDFFHLQFFQAGIPLGGNGYPEMNLQVPSFNPLIATIGQGGLGPVSWLELPDEDPNREILYTFGCRDLGPDNWDDESDGDALPSLEQFEFFNGKPVGIKYTTPTTCCFTITFPLAYMEIEETRAFMNQVINELNIQ